MIERVEITAFKNSRGKIPPQAREFEEAVLGALLVSQKAAFLIMDKIDSRVFYIERHRFVFEAMHLMFSKGNPIDLLTVSEQLKKMEYIDRVGGSSYLIQLTKKVSSHAHVDFHVRILLQKYIQREIIRIANESIQKAYADDVDSINLLDEVYTDFSLISETVFRPEVSSFANVIDSVIKRGGKIYRGEIEPAIPSPITKLNAKAGGFRDTELIILAARPGMGKTAFVLSVGLHASKKGYPTAFFSLEMGKEQLTSRIISMEAKIDSQKFTVDGLDEHDEKKARRAEGSLAKLPFYINEVSSLTIEQFVIESKIMKKKYGIKLIIVDYLQLMTGKGGSREQEISKISRGLKMVAKELNLPVIALSQLSRAVESRGGSKRPMLSDLRESGAIEQDADVVMFLFRPEYYGITEWDDDERTPTEGEAEYIVAKNRNGGLIRNRMRFEAEYTLFSDLTRSDPFAQRTDKLAHLK